MQALAEERQDRGLLAAVEAARQVNGEMERIGFQAVAVACQTVHEALYLLDAMDVTIVWVGHCVAAALEAGDTSAQTRFLLLLCAARLKVGNVELAVITADEADRVIASIGNPMPLVARAACHRAKILMARGLLREGAQLLDRVIAEVKSALVRPDADLTYRILLHQAMFERAVLALESVDLYRPTLTFRSRTPEEHRIFDGELLLSWRLFCALLRDAALPPEKRPLVWMNVCVAAHLMGLTELAESAFRAMLRFEEGHNLAREIAAGWLMEMCALRGDRSGMEEMWRLSGAAQTIGTYRVGFLIGRARALLFLGCVDEARASAGEALDAATDSGLHLYRYKCQLLLDEIDRQQDGAVLVTQPLDLSPDLKREVDGLHELAAAARLHTAGDTFLLSRESWPVRQFR